MSEKAEHRITEVIAHPLAQRLSRPNKTSWGVYSEVSIVLVEVRTASGIVGVGETLARFSPKAYVDLIETSLKPRLLGQDATDIAALWQLMRRALSGRAGGMLIEAIAGVDDSVEGDSKVTLTIEGDLKPLFTGIIKKGDKPKLLNLPVLNVKELRITVESDFLDLGNQVDLGGAKVRK